MHDISKPFGITNRLALLTMVLARNGYKFKTPRAVEVAYVTLLYTELNNAYNYLFWANNIGVVEMSKF